MAAAIRTPAAESKSQRRLPDGYGGEGGALTPELWAWMADADWLTDAGCAMPELEAAAANGAAETAESAAGTVPEIAAGVDPEIAAGVDPECPDSVSRLSRCRSVRSSAAL